MRALRPDPDDLLAEIDLRDEARDHENRFRVIMASNSSMISCRFILGTVGRPLHGRHGHHTAICTFVSSWPRTAQVGLYGQYGSRDYSGPTGCEAVWGCQYRWQQTTLGTTGVTGDLGLAIRRQPEY